MTIQEPRVTKFLSESVRPLAERINALEAVLDDISQEWTNEVSAVLTSYAGTEVIDDGRAAEGVSVLTKGDLLKFLGHAQSILTAIQAANRGELRKPVVRGLKFVR